MSVAVIPGDPPIEVHLKRSARARRISLKVGRLDGRVTLSMPRAGSLDEAMDFARSKEDWIRNVLPKARLPIWCRALAGVAVLGRLTC